MSNSENLEQGNLDLISFLNDYAHLLERQLTSVQAALTSTVTTVMDNITQLSKATVDIKKSAESALEETYMKTDQATTELINIMQKSVDDLIDQARKGVEGTSETLQPNSETAKALEKLNDRFNKPMLELNSLEGKMKELIFSMIGALSMDDVISQRLEHVCICIEALQYNMAPLLLDFQSRCTPENIQRFKKELFDYTLKIYSIPDERRLFNEVFKPKAA